MPAGAVIAGMRAALEAGSVSPDVVAIEARKHLAASRAAADTPARGPRPSRAAVVNLPAPRSAAAPPDARPAPSMAAYDQLLATPPAAGRRGAR